MDQLVALFLFALFIYLLYLILRPKRLQIYEPAEGEWWMAYSGHEAFMLAKAADWRAPDDELHPFPSPITESELDDLTFQKDDDSIWSMREQFEHLKQTGQAKPGLFATSEY